MRRRALRFAACVALGAPTTATAAPGRASGGDNAPGPRLAPLIDKAKATRAIAAYRKFMNEFCDHLWLTPDDGKPMRPAWIRHEHDAERTVAQHDGQGEVRDKLYSVGLPTTAEEIDLCERRELPAKPLATGSFMEAGADEVLLEVWNGTTGLGPSTVALLRAEGKDYKLVTHLQIGVGNFDNHFEARARLTTPSRIDALFLCETGGAEGVYASTCGFFGHGDFRPAKPRPPGLSAEPDEPPDTAGRDDEINLARWVKCGPTLSLALGKLDLRGDRVVVDLTLEGAVGEPASREDKRCQRQTHRTSRHFPIEFTFDGSRFKRVTPTPPEVIEALNKN